MDQGAPIHSLARGAATIAYRASPDHTDGRHPGVVFLGGFRSDMTGIKATTLEAFAAGQGLGFCRFDYQGHGASGTPWEDCTIGMWREDALAILDRATTGPQILVGSSMGGWIALLAALARPERVAGLVLVAPAPDFTRRLILDRLDAATRAALDRDGRFVRPSAYDPAGYVITRRLLEEGDGHRLLHAPIAIGCPVRILHGMLDGDVPWTLSMELVERLTGGDVRLTLIKDGDHRLSRPQDLDLLTRTLGGLAGIGR